ncbi:MAG TPA: hypothetical protein VHC50_04510, partial [Puia sp.]|nr:hypothetical protein [Puia sp.]
GVGLNCPHTPGISIDRPGIGVYSRSRTLTSGAVFSNLYNNAWGTNFTEWIEGSHAAKFYVWSYKNYSAPAALVTPAEETRTPLSAAYYAPTGLSFAYNYETSGELPDTQPGLMLDRKGVLVTSFNEHGNEAMIRLWEEAGSSGKCTVTLPRHSSFKVAYPCNLRGERTANAAGIPISNNSFDFEIGPNQPRTFLLK